jgi:hypothetical protein
MPLLLEQTAVKIACGATSILFCLYLAYRAWKNAADRCAPAWKEEEEAPIGEAAWPEGPPRFNG